MKLKYSNKGIIDIPTIIIKYEKIISANIAFLNLTEYEESDITFCDISFVIKDLLRSSLKLDYTLEKHKYVSYIFTKSLIYKEIIILQSNITGSEEIILKFLKKSGARIENKLPLMEKLLSDQKMGVGIFRVPELMLIKANQRYLNFFEEPFNNKEKSFGCCLKDMISNFAGSAAEKAFNNVIESDETLYLNEVKFTNKNFEEKYWDNTIMVSQEIGSVKYVVSMLSDVTERVISREQAMNQAKELDIQKKLLEAIIDNMPDASIIFDKDGCFTMLNKAAIAITPDIKINQVGDRLKTAAFYDINENMLEPCSAPAARVIRGEKLVNHRLIQKDDKAEIHFDVNGTPVYDENGNFQFGVMCWHDVTEYVQQNKRLERNWLELKTIFENMRDSIYVVSKEGEYIFQNQAARKFLPDVKIDRVGDSASAKYYDMENDEITLEKFPVKRILRGSEVHAVHMKMVYRDIIKYFSVSGTPIYDENGSVEYAVLSSRDITEKIEHENIIKEQQKQILIAQIERNASLQNAMERLTAISELEDLNKMKDNLISIVAHDIRDPIASMITLMEILDEVKEICSSDTSKIIDAVGEQVKNTYGMIENLLQWFRSQKDGLMYQPWSWELSRIIYDVAKAYQIKSKTKGIFLGIDVSDETKIFADKGMLEMVLRNLLSNAIKYTSMGGEILIRANEAKQKVIVSISDTGVGISDDKLNTLFQEAYFTSDLGTGGEKGIGLGLALCKEFVQRNGGEIWVESTIGKGSTFYFSLPVYKGHNS